MIISCQRPQCGGSLMLEWSLKQHKWILVCHLCDREVEIKEEKKPIKLNYKIYAKRQGVRL